MWNMKTISVLAAAVVAGSAMAEERSLAEFMEFEGYGHCEMQGREMAPCMAEKRAEAAAAIDMMAVYMPRLVAQCEAEHSDPLAVVWCLLQATAGWRVSSHRPQLGETR